MNAKDSNQKSQTDWDKVDHLSEEEIDTSDIPPLGRAFFNEAELRIHPNKKSVTVRLDADVLEWFKRQGKGYRTKINAVLRLYMEAHSE